jgi:hypothetical protein
LLRPAASLLPLAAADFEREFWEGMGEEECRYLYSKLDRARREPGGARDVLSFTACD